MNKVKELVKQGTRLVVSCGVGTIIANAVAATTPVGQVALVTKLAITVGTLALSGVVGDRCSDYTDKKIDELAEEIEKKTEKSEEKTEE